MALKELPALKEAHPTTKRSDGTEKSASRRALQPHRMALEEVPALKQAPPITAAHHPGWDGTERSASADNAHHPGSDGTERSASAERSAPYNHNFNARHPGSGGTGRSASAERSAPCSDKLIIQARTALCHSH